MTVKIRLLGRDANKTGDLFGRLMADVLHSLGYENPRFNIHKSGRELDITAVHRTELRTAVAECKATDDPVGGSDLNKFYGALDAERRSAEGTEILGYFISLNGFRETAIQQEKDIGASRFVLMDGNGAITQLIQGNVIVSPQDAAAKAAALLPDGSFVSLDPGMELLAHETGWIWTVYFRQNKVRTRFSFIHADGEVLAESLAKEVIGADEAFGRPLQDLTYLGPDDRKDITRDEAVERYTSYIDREYGGITLEGLPTDQQVGGRQLKLESLFVPLHLEPFVPPDDKPSPDHDVATRAVRQPVGEVLARYPRIAVLASPGGGKTTLLKRLAVAYAAPGRRPQAADELPERNWLPIVIRCRHLGDLASKPLLEILKTLPGRAEMPELADAFMAVVADALRSGQLLLLVDGLDEIPDPASRMSFVTQLRTFLGTYPSINLIVSSREVGYRHVASTLSSFCSTYRLGELSNEDIRSLTRAWHREVVGPRPEVIAEAEKLTTSIVESDRVRRLACNPLLLTTLLLVKRWVGELPRKRSVLYAKAMEVLLMTWNVEGHTPIDQDEALPQLSFAAYSMMTQGVQRVSAVQLTQLFNEARRQMPEELGYASISVHEFVQRVEERSSLLSISGHQVEDGILQPTYEFKHLTFQEYLAALAIAKGWYPDRVEGTSVAEVLGRVLEDEGWQEVVPLTAVLAGRQGGEIVQSLCNLLPPVDPRATQPLGSREPRAIVAKNLAQCLIDEVQLAPQLARSALKAYLEGERYRGEFVYKKLLEGRYAEELRVVARDGYSSFNHHFISYAGALAAIVLVDLGYTSGESKPSQVVRRLCTGMEAEDWLSRVEGALGTMACAHQQTWPDPERRAQRRNQRWKITKPGLKRLATHTAALLDSADPREIAAACWALVWLNLIVPWTPVETAKLATRLFTIWREARLTDEKRLAAWAIWTLPITKRLHLDIELSTDTDRFLRKALKSKEWNAPDYARAAITIATCMKGPWRDAELTNMIVSHGSGGLPPEETDWARRVLSLLGVSGRRGLRELEQKGEERKRARPRPSRIPKGE